MQIKVNARPASMYLSQVAREQLPFAVALALTRTAQEGQKVVLQALPAKFTLRKGWWQPKTRMGINYQPATKTRWVSSVYTRASWMALQEEGGIKSPKARALAVPSRQVFPAQKLIPKAKRPKALMAHQRPAFILQTRRGAAIAWRRTKRAPLQIFYRLIGQARIRPVLRMREDVSRVVEQKWKDNFARTFDEAMRSAK